MASNRNSNRTTKRDSEGRFTGSSWTDSARERPYATAAVAAGVAAAGAFLWSKRGQIGEAAGSGMDRLSELKDEYMGSGETRSQAEIAEEALSLKETGVQSSSPTGSSGQQPSMQQQSKAGAVAY